MNRVYTSHAVLDIRDGRFVLKEKLKDMSIDDLLAMTGADLHVSGKIADLAVPSL